MSYQRTDTLLLRVNDLVFGYEPGKPVLYNLDWEIRDLIHPDQVTGQIVCLLGSSGSGKSTLLNLLAGHLRPRYGTVEVMGHASKQLTTTLKGEVGVVYQNYALFEHLTVYQNLVLGARQGAVQRDWKEPLRSWFSRKAREASPFHQAAVAMAREFGLEQQLSQYPAQLSGGQRQRVAIAQQLLFQRQILILDEPFSGLDHLAKMRAIQAIQTAAHLSESNTLIIITHDIEAAVRVGDTICLLGPNEGEDPGASIRLTVDLAAKGLSSKVHHDDPALVASVVKEVEAFFESLAG